MPVNELLVIVLLIAASAFFSMSEISLAASRKIKLRLMAEGGHINAQRVLALQDSPGNFFTVVQIGLNAVAILGGVMGEQALSPYVTGLLRTAYDGLRVPVEQGVLSDSLRPDARIVDLIAAGDFAGVESLAETLIDRLRLVGAPRMDSPHLVGAPIPLDVEVDVEFLEVPVS